MCIQLNRTNIMASLHIDKREVVLNKKHRQNGGELGVYGGPGMTRTSDLYFIRVAL